MGRLVWLVLVSVLGLLGGCGDDTECVVDTDCPNVFDRCEMKRCIPSGSQDAGADTGAHGDSGTLDAGPPDGGPPDGGPEERRIGSVFAEQFPQSFVTTAPNVLSASFSVVAGEDGCMTQTVEGCEVRDCPSRPVPPDAGTPVDAGSVPLPHAGMITLVGDAMELTITPGSDGSYADSEETGLVWSSGSEVIVTAAGDTVPAFSRMFDGPGQATIVSPDFMTLPLEIDRATDYTLTWADGATGTLEVRVAIEEATSSGTRTVTVRCGFDAAESTSGALPVAALAMLPTGPDGYIGVRTVEGDMLEPGDGWRVDVELRTIARTEIGTAATGAVTIVDGAP